MKVNVKIAGASYNGVPSVSIPLQAGGTATFCEVSDTTATSADVATGKKFYTAAGELATGTNEQVNADWNENDADSKAFIKNKPTIATKSDVDELVQWLTGSFTTNSLTVNGESSVPTANEGNSSSTIASTEFVAKSIAKLVDSAPESLNTLNELSKALGDDPNFSTTVLNELAKKLNAKEATDTFATKTEVSNLQDSTVAKTELWNADKHLVFPNGAEMWVE